MSECQYIASLIGQNNTYFSPFGVSASTASMTSLNSGLSSSLGTLSEGTVRIAIGTRLHLGKSLKSKYDLAKERSL